MSSPFENFTWGDRASKITKNDEGDLVYQPRQKGGLSILGDVLTGVGDAFAGQPHKNSGDGQNQLDQEMAFRVAAENAKRKDPVALLKDLEAKAKLSAFVKQQQSLPLSDFEKNLIGYKDPNNKPTDMELYRQAYNQSITRLGGSAMVGISPDKSSQLDSTVRETYLGLKKQFGTETPEEKFERAKLYLRQNGYAAGDTNASAFLKQNEGF